MARKALLALVVLVVAAIGLAGISALLAARDDSTVTPAAGPGVTRTVVRGPDTLVGDNQPITPGNVVLFYSDERLTRRLRTLARDIGGTPSAALQAAGQAVTVQRRPNQQVPVVALTTTRRIEAGSPGAPALRAFIEYWLGRKS